MASKYDSILDSVLSEVGMTHQYVPFWDRRQPGKVIIESIDDHIITMKRQGRFLGFPYSRNIEVARIESESVRSYSNGHSLRYAEVMKIKIIDKRGEKTLMSIGQKISDRLNAEVDILKGY